MEPRPPPHRPRPPGPCPPCGTGAQSNAASRPGSRPSLCLGRRGARCLPSRRRTAEELVSGCLGLIASLPASPSHAPPGPPALTTQDREPSRSRMQSAFSWHGLGVPSGQKRCARGRQPDAWSPTKPGWHGPHWKEPCAQGRERSVWPSCCCAPPNPPPFFLGLTRVLMHTEFGTQLCCPVSHSLISVQTWVARRAEVTAPTDILRSPTQLRLLRILPLSDHSGRGHFLSPSTRPRNPPHPAGAWQEKATRLEHEFTEQNAPPILS